MRVMELVQRGTTPGQTDAVDPRIVDPHLGEAGTSPGINIEPGSDDDGWIVPDPVPLADGTQLQLYKDGEALHAAYNAIEQAQHRVCLEVYIFADDDTGHAFADLLCRKASEGLRVYVVYDSLGSMASDRQMFRRMQRAGVHLEKFHPIRPWECRYSWRPANRDHRKLLVVDYDLAGLGGLNVGAEYAGSWVMPSTKEHHEFWRDTSLGVRGPSAKHFLRAFSRTWHYVTHGGPIARAEHIYDIAGPGAVDDEVGVLASVPTMHSSGRAFLQKIFREAKKSVQMTMAYFAPDDLLINELCRAAKRGVKVQLMLPARSDVKALLIAQRAFYEVLMCAGVEIYERQVAVLHAKTMVIDDCISLVGSMNLDYRSIEYNLEISAVVRSEVFGRQMNVLFDNDIRFAKRITLSEWRKRPWSDRCVQWMVKRARYLL